MQNAVWTHPCYPAFDLFCPGGSDSGDSSGESDVSDDGDQDEEEQEDDANVSQEGKQ